MLGREIEGMNNRIEEQGYEVNEIARRIRATRVKARIGAGIIKKAVGDIARVIFEPLENYFPDTSQPNQQPNQPYPQSDQQQGGL